MTDNDREAERAHRALVVNVQTRIAARGRDAVRLVDELLTMLERADLEYGDLRLDDPSTYPNSSAVSLLAWETNRRLRAQAARLAEIEDDEMPVYGGGQ